MISIVIPTRNNSSTIKYLLDSLKIQSFKDFEVVIVDSSIDNTPIIASQYNFVKIIKCPPLGANLARNIGINNAKGEIIAFTDGDCRVEKDWLKNIYTFFKKNPEIHVVGGSVYTAKELRGNIIADYYNDALWPMMPIYSHEMEVKIDNFHLIRPPNSNNLSIRKKIFENKLFFDENFRGGYEETELLWRILLRGYRVKVSPKICVEHFHTKSLSKLLKRAYNYGRGHYIFLRKYRNSPLALYGSILIYVYTFLYIPLIFITIYFNYIGSILLLLAPYIVFMFGYLRRKIWRRMLIYPFIDLIFYTFMALGFIKEKISRYLYG